MTKPTLKSTKQEILEAYEVALTELNQAKKDLTQAKKVVTKPTTNNTVEKVDTKATEPVIMCKNEVSVEAIVNELSHLQNQFGDAASTLQQQLSAEALNLQNLNTEVAKYREQLKLLHHIEVAEQTLSTLMEQYESTAEQQQSEYSAKQKALSEQLAQLRQEWAREQKEHELTLAESDKALKKQRQREQDEYDYNFDQQKKQDEAEYNQLNKNYEDQLALIKEKAELAWAELEETLKKEEKEAADLIEKAENADKDLEKAVKKAEDEGTGIAKGQVKNAADLMKKDFDGKRRVFELRINSLEATVAKQTNHIQVLTKQLSTALQQAQDLAVKALEGSSNAKSFAAMKEIALEQAKNAQKGK
ncbi:MAG: hypothetical protein RLZZ422_1741 [Pseudomonadota bacterium]|jgi:hypothetical protein